jgi:hypothetical protein
VLSIYRALSLLPYSLFGDLLNHVAKGVLNGLFAWGPFRVNFNHLSFKEGPIGSESARDDHKGFGPFVSVLAALGSGFHDQGDEINGALDNAEALLGDSQTGNHQSQIEQEFRPAFMLNVFALRRVFSMRVSVLLNHPTRDRTATTAEATRCNSDLDRHRKSTVATTLVKCLQSLFDVFLPVVHA